MRAQETGISSLPALGSQGAPRPLLPRRVVDCRAVRSRYLVLALLLACSTTGCLTDQVVNYANRTDSIFDVYRAFRSDDGRLWIRVEASMGGEWQQQKYTMYVEPEWLAEMPGPDVPATDSDLCDALALPRSAVAREAIPLGGAGAVDVPIRMLAASELRREDTLRELWPEPGHACTLYYSSSVFNGEPPYMVLVTRHPFYAQPCRITLTLEDDSQGNRVWPYALTPFTLVLDVIGFITIGAWILDGVGRTPV